MLINRTVERVRASSWRDMGLGDRARAARDLPPLVLVPPMLGTRLRDLEGRPLWGWTRSLFFGPAFETPRPVRPDGVLRELTLVPRLFAHDVHGGLIRYLVRIGGYREAKTLFPVAYDWRLGVARGAVALAAAVGRIRDARRGPVDLLCISSGGLVARHFLAAGGSSEVRRAIFVGTPHRGTVQAARVLREGFRLAPLGRRFHGASAARCQITYDLLPHPAEPVLVDPAGTPVEGDLFDPRLWREGGLLPHHVADLDEKLGRAREAHLDLDRAAPLRDAFIVAGRHMATRSRVIVTRGRATLPPCHRDDRECRPPFFQPGDGSVPESSAVALPGIDPSRIRFAAPRQHRSLPSDPEVHRLVLEALLAPCLPRTATTEACAGASGSG